MLQSSGKKKNTITIFSLTHSQPLMFSLFKLEKHFPSKEKLNENYFFPRGIPGKKKGGGSLRYLIAQWRILGRSKQRYKYTLFLLCAEGFSAIQLVMAFQPVIEEQCRSAVMRSAGNGSPRLMNTWGGCGSLIQLREGIEIVKYTLQFSLGLTNHKIPTTK